MSENNATNETIETQLTDALTNSENFPLENLPMAEELPLEQKFMEQHTQVSGEILTLLKNIESLQHTNSREITEMNRKYHNGFADVITRQQAELDAFREGLGRNALVGLLKIIAGLYSDHEKYVSLDDPTKVQKCYQALLEELLQILHENGVQEYTSKVGEKYSVKHCKPFEKIKTDDKEQHGVVAESRNIGLYVDKTILVPERVKIYVYDESYTNKEMEG